MSRLLDKEFKYVPSCATDIRKTIAKEKKRLKAVAEEKAKEDEAIAKAGRSILHLPQRKGK